MARPVVFDTTEFIQLLRYPDRIQEFVRTFQRQRVWLTAVTTAELYAGSRSVRDARNIDRVVAAFSRVDHLLTPTSDDWRQAGQLIARSIRLYGSVEPRDHLADVLIVVIAARLSGTVVTANLGHFERWGRLARQAGLDVTVTPSGAYS